MLLLSAPPYTFPLIKKNISDATTATAAITTSVELREDENKELTTLEPLVETTELLPGK